MKIGAYIGLNGWLPLRSHISACDNLKSLDVLLKETLTLSSNDDNTSRALADLSSPVDSRLETSVLLAHTFDDEVIDVALGREARDTLTKIGFRVSWRDNLGGGHLGLLKRKGLDSVGAFLRKRGL